MASWSKAGAEQDLSEVTTSTIRMLDEDGQKGLLFAAIRGELKQFDRKLSQPQLMFKLYLLTKYFYLFSLRVKCYSQCVASQSLIGSVEDVWI